jgi:hypothetical protein
MWESLLPKASAIRRSVMKTTHRLAFALAASLTAVLFGAQIAAQVPAAGTATRSAKTWIGQASTIEEELKTAPIVRWEDIGTGVTRPKRGYFDPGRLVASFTWKPLPPGVRRGYFESYKAEIAAYELDKLLLLNMVPPVVERTTDGQLGAAVMWVEPTTSVKQMGGTLSPGRVPGRDIRRMHLFDNFIGNPDRNGGNILVDGAGEIILIDHSRAFTSDKRLPNKLERVDAGLWEAVLALDADRLRANLGSLIGDPAVTAMIARRDRMGAEVGKLVEKKGRAQVIIP